MPNSESVPLTIEGYYSDGVLRDISEFFGITYMIDDTLIAQHYSGRSIYGKQVGQTSLTVSYLGKSKNANINVYQGVNWGVAAFSCTNNSVCRGSTLSFHNNSTYNPISILWQFPGGTPSTSTLQDPIITYNSEGTYNVTLIATYAGKSDTLSLINYITVNPIPATPTITAGSATTFCQGASVILTSNGTSGNQWYKDGVAIIGLTGTTLNVTTSGSYTTKITLNGCESALSNAVVITVNPIPATPTITAGSATTFCQGGSVTLTSNTTSGNQWYKDGVVIGASTATTYIASASGSYTTKVTLNGCESAVSNAIVVTVNPIPATPTITAGTATTFCSGGSVTLTSNAASGNQWYKDGVAISGSAATALNVTASGSYTVNVTVNVQ
jgi:PKD repeat protein